MTLNIKKILKELTLEEKASLLSGADFWHTKAVERLAIPQIMVSDGPHGLRKNAEGSANPNEAIKSVCFPTACALACSFDRNLLTMMGKALGEECQAEKVSVILGPGCNIKRSPLCGRNFEYFSEDPYLAGEMAAAHIKGVQSKGVGTSLKHFAANNQENRRLTINERIDERTLREIYLAPFEIAVKQADPWTIMCSYNRINGYHSSQNKWLLTDVLRNDWGYSGLVMSDWGAVDDRVAGVKAGLDLEMPASFGKNDKLIVDAVNRGELSMEAVDKCTERVLRLTDKAEESRTPAKWDMEAHHELAAKIEAQCAVLLKNDDDILPLDRNDKICFIGEFAAKPRYQGGGSSHINSFKAVSALEAVKDYCKVEYAQGYITEEDRTVPELLEQAVDCAKYNDKVVIFAGLPESFESEGYDRTHMRMPDCQIELINEIYKVNKNIIVVLHNGSPVELPFIGNIKALLEMYLGGQGVGKATCELLFGDAAPCGRLAESWCMKLEDTPSYLNFPGVGDEVSYSEGVFVGYRYYDKKKMEVRFPFGFGLSYTKFEYSDLVISENEINEDQTLTVSCTVTNVGSRTGSEVVQLYVGDKESSVMRPVKELKGFEKITLKAGESRKVVFSLDKRAFAYYETAINDWFVEYGEFEIMVGASSRDIRLTGSVYVNGTAKLPVHFTFNSTVGDVLSCSEGKEVFGGLIDKFCKGMTDMNGDGLGSNSMELALAMLKDTPMRGILCYDERPEINRVWLQEMLDRLNAMLEG
ncbi:MAG: glycoside hydrolase family 3 C-terminal domain-containing protein [Ruminococcus sp.]|uniref:glycoside hydrolase family 3 C-terminal domain-containing protein n=1 Tax=Ruminococcus sp. TaxID=41978 RepID=UPI0025F6D7C2|nr:glycoside hydrolase family 3 C-terminal domain-containing protein [Ruminococcus sp.]MBR0530946.1 glycoside hydrolase family 3 C-terminal domain-containing protein [Ruminococcus sp.]